MISIVIPIFNAEKTLKYTLDSCLNQTYREFEIIAVNDQSTDGTEDILNEYAKYKQIKIFNTKDINDKGIVAALNYGIKQASGEYIARIDADDLMSNVRLEKQIIPFQNNPELVLCSTDAFLIDEKNNPLNALLFSTSDISDLDYKCCIIHPSVMFRRNYFIENNLFYKKEFEYAEDYELWLHLRSIAKGNYYYHIPEQLISYRLGKTNISSAHSKEQRQKAQSLFKLYNIKPYLSIINLGDENLLKENLGKTAALNWEIISEKQKPQGKYIAYSKYENDPQRFEQQIQLLQSNNKLVACGTYINNGKNVFFYTSDSDTIENELLKGKIAIEQSTILFRNCLKEYRTNDYFGLLCNLMFYGAFTNVSKPLVKIEGYSGVLNSDFTSRIKRAKIAYKDIVNIVHINITSDGNFSGVDRYLKTMEENYPPNVRCKRITLKANPTKFELDNSNRDHVILRYNTTKTKLDHMQDLIWDNCSYMFQNKRNLIVQSNCFNLYTLINWIRQKVALKHVCMLHCVPYREVIRSDREAYAKLETLFFDETKEFAETAWHYDAVNTADYAIVNTEDAEFYYNRAGYSAPYSLIHNGIEKIGKGNRVYNGKEPFRFIFVGHSSPLKGFDQLLPVIKQVSQKHSIEVHWCGSADGTLRSKIEKSGLPIIIHGVLPPELLNKVYQEVDCALIATACETCSYAAIEALSAGLPIIATRAHGVKEIVENVGLLVDIDIHAIIKRDMYEDAMLKVIEDDELRKELSRRSEKAFVKYSKENLMKESLKLYRKLLCS
jgi:glycosyltransferase involved in cell wall biosynthesis